MFIFGFIVAATLGCTAGSVDLTEGMFRHLVVTGRSRLALYLARIPAGLAIIVPMVAVGFTIVCAVCVFAAPTQLDYQGVTVPPGLSHAAFETLGRRPRRRGHLQLQLQLRSERRPIVPVRQQRPAAATARVSRSAPGRGAPQPTVPRRGQPGRRPSRSPTRTTRTTRATSSRRRSR